MRRTALFLLGLVVVVGGSAVVVADGDITVLKGLDKLKIVIERLEDDEKRAGLSESRLYTDMALRLRSYGLRPEVVVGSFLYFATNGMLIDYTHKDSHYAYTYSCEYRQAVTTANGTRTIGTVWLSPGALGFVPSDKFVDSVRNHARNCADDFVAAFLEANPDFTPPAPSD